MSDNPFHKLAPFIQEYIYRNEWEELHQVQVDACKVIFDSDDHLIIASGTASGKTEAAFFPILTLLSDKPSESIGVLYIGPLKALINDQFQRLNGLLNEANIPVWHWHGDVSQSEKMKLLKNPSGILQITPESLEALLMNRVGDVVNLFRDLQFVIIDEIHAFYGTDRGSQILCQLARIQKLAGCNPRRIGLSATVSDYESAKEWIASGNVRKVSLIEGKIGGRKIRLAVENFKLPDVIDTNKVPKEADEYYEFLYQSCSKKKCLIFTNSRAEAEMTINAMRNIAIEKREPDIFYVHHGSISKVLREEAEAALRDTSGPTVAAATLTLELGIDIGDLERIIQINTPWSCSSFVQRLGRSGRRTNISEMWFVHEEFEDESNSVLENIPWSLLQNIAIIELYRDEQWIEPFRQKKLPYSLLYHQTMSLMASQGELPPNELARKVLSLPPFKNIELEDFRTMLKHLIETEHIQRMEDRELLIGLKGERITNNYHFYAVFQDNVEFKVVEQTKEIGSIASPPPIGQSILLAGRAWKIVDLDWERKIVYVKASGGKAKSSWHGGAGNVHARILIKMKEILDSDQSFAYLQKRASQRLEETRDVCRKIKMTESCISQIGEHSLVIMPWTGSIQLRTIERILQCGLKDELEISITSGMIPYYLIIRTQLSKDIFEKKLLDFCLKGLDDIPLLNKNEVPFTDKYDCFLPNELVIKGFQSNELDLDGATNALLAALRVQPNRI